MAILASYGLPFQKITTVNLGGEVQFAAKIEPHLYGTYTLGAYFYSSYTMRDPSVFSERPFTFGRFVVHGYIEHPLIPKNPLSFVAKPESKEGAKDGDPVGTYSRPQYGAPVDPEGGIPIRGSSVSATLSYPDMIPTNKADVSRWELDRQVFLEKNPAYFPVSKYDIEYPLGREGVVNFLSHWSGGPSVPTSATRGLLDPQPYSTDGYLIYTGQPELRGPIRDFTNSLEYMAIPVQYPVDEDAHVHHYGFIFNELKPEPPWFEERWRIERAAAVERERPHRVKNSNRLLAALSSGRLPVEYATAVLSKKPFFMEGFIPVEFTITILPVEVLDYPEVVVVGQNGENLARYNHPARPYGYTPAVVEKHQNLGPSGTGYTWTTGRRENLAAAATVSIKLKRTVRIEYMQMNEALPKPVLEKKTHTIEGTLTISTHAPQAHESGQQNLLYFAENWPHIGEDGLSPYYAEFAEFLDFQYANRNTDWFPSSVKDLVWLADAAVVAREAEKVAAKSYLDSLVGTTDAFVAARAAAQVLLDKATTAETDTKAVRTSIMDAATADKEYTPPYNFLLIDKWGEGLYTPVIIDGTFGADYTREKVAYCASEDRHPSAELLYRLGGYITIIDEQLERAILAKAIADNGTDDAEKTATGQARDRLQAALTWALAKQTSLVNINTAAHVKAENNKATVKPFQSIVRYLAGLEPAERGYFDV